MTLEELKRKGYCITSRSGRIASRLDRPDWEENMPSGMKPNANFYRRCVSKDHIIVPASYLSKLKNSIFGYVKYRP